MNVACAHSHFNVWQNMLMKTFNEKYPLNYTGINILGTLQVLGNVPGAEIGLPNVMKGSPCSMNYGCVHPNPGTEASRAIGEQFWLQFFSKHVVANGQAFQWTPINKKFPVPPVGDIEAIRTKCMWNWNPSVTDM